MSDLLIFLSLVWGILGVALFIKIWKATNNIAKSKQLLEEILNLLSKTKM